MKKINIISIFSALLLLVVFNLSGQNAELFFKAAGSPANPKVQASWNHYYTDAGIIDLCNKLAKAYPNLVSLESIGKSYQGRDILCLTISDKKAGNPDLKPGYWIDGNIHSIEIQGTEMALYTAWYLCEMYDGNTFIRNLLGEKTFYIAPTINPDAREYFTSVGVPPRSGLAPRDNDRDGKLDEDGPDDLNGDKEISQMRRKNPEGNYIIDPMDPRKMIRVQYPQKGEYELLGSEGIDNDGDGLVNEDGPGGYDGNRDWGFNWEPNYIQSGADKYPFTFPENQAVRDFVVKHRNIAGSQSFHNSGGMILRGPSIQGGGAEVFNRADEQVLNTIGMTGQKMIPGYKLLTIWKDLYTVWGGELDWMYGGMGCYVYSNELWTPYLMFNDTTNTDEYEFDRLLLYEDAFIPWKKAMHPVYGEIEIGGFSKNFGRMHPGFLLEADAHRNAAFCIYNAYQLPKLEVSKVKVKDLGNGLKEVTSAIENRRMIPTHSGSNIRYKIDPPDYVYLDGGTVIAGMIVEDADNNIATEQKKNPQRMELANIPGILSAGGGFGGGGGSGRGGLGRGGGSTSSKVNIKWIVKGGTKFTVRVESVKGGSASGQSE
jgi:hypothetical protein